MYHRVAPDGAERMRRWRVTPSELDAQLRALRRRGYQSVDLAEWRDAAFAREALPGRPIVLTFDDGYEDFLEWAWPICARHGFSAVLFVVADHVGGTNAWDSADSGEEVRLLGWPELRALAEDGVVIGSHTASHPRLAEISPSDALREMARSRAEISRRLGVQVDALAYPYGDFDTAVRRLAGAAGYTFAVTCEVRRAEFGDSLLTLPRIEVEGGMGPARFLAAVEGRTPPPD
jgi:peptidoglycan/xylan/chitin deacetylase (PgdA/CDA1 family)